MPKDPSGEDRLRGKCGRGIAFCVLIGGLWASCSSATGPGAIDFIVLVDSIDVPVSVRDSDPLRVRVLGRVGPDSCYALAQVESVFVPAGVDRSSRLELTFHGRNESVPDAACLQTVSSLDWSTVLLPPHGGAEVEIIVHQPDGSIFQRDVEIDAT